MPLWPTQERWPVTVHFAAKLVHGAARSHGRPGFDQQLSVRRGDTI